MVIPTHNRELVEAVYHTASRLDLENDADWGAYVVGADGRRMAHETFARGVVTRFDLCYDDPEGVRRFDAGYETRIRTRLGDETIRVELPGEVRGWYSDEKVRWVDLPPWVVTAGNPTGELEQARDSDRVPEVVDFTPGERGAWFRIGDSRVEYRPDGWTWRRPSGEGEAEADD